MASFAAAAAADFTDPPDPEVFARAEDQERARLLTTPCTSADFGHGCYHFNGSLYRRGPCTYDAGNGSIASLPTDEGYRMEPPQRYRGV